MGFWPQSGHNDRSITATQHGHRPFPSRSGHPTREEISRFRLTFRVSQRSFIGWSDHHRTIQGGL